jgi:hypothetical protein
MLYLSFQWKLSHVYSFYFNGPVFHTLFYLSFRCISPLILALIYRYLLDLNPNRFDCGCPLKEEFTLKNSLNGI